MAIQSPTISNFIADQFPQFYREEGPQFITFMEAYFEWMEQEGNPIGGSRNILQYRDVDTTLEQFMSHFNAKYLYGIPEKVRTDKRFLIKHVLDVYRAKGTIQGYKLLFKLLYDEDITIYLPSRDIFATSVGDWYEPRFVEVRDVPNLNDLVGEIVKGQSSSAEAVVDSYIKQPVNNSINHILYLTNITGNFVRGEKLVKQEDFGQADKIQAATTIRGSFAQLQIVQGGQQFKVGDTLVAINGAGIEGEALITRVANGTGTLAISVLSGGSLYSMDAEEIFTRRLIDGSGNEVVRVPGSNTQPQGRGASFDVGSITNVQQITYNNDLIIDKIDNTFIGGVSSIRVTANGANYSNTVGNTATQTTLTFTPRSHIAEVRIDARGTGYSNGDTITVTGGTANAVGAIQTMDNGAILGIDLKTPGQWETPGAATVIVTSAMGGGATLTPVLVTTGSGAAGYIVTNNGKNVTEARVTNPGSAYVVPPVVAVGTPGSGSGATFQANVAVNYAFRPNRASNNYSTVQEILDYNTKLFGEIGSLTNIATGNNYSTDPHVAVRDFIISQRRAGNVYFSNSGIEVRGIGTKFTSDFTPGDVIKLEIVDDAAIPKVDYRIIKTIANNTYLTVDDNPRYNANGNIDMVYVTQPGNLYKNTDSVSFIGGDGFGATGRITTDVAGSIVKFELTKRGDGYTTAPTITVTSNTGTGASFYSMITASDYFLAANTISAQFDRRYDLPIVSYIGDTNAVHGENAVISAPPVFGVGIIRDVKIKNSGFGYAESEYINFATYGAIKDVIIDSRGTGYANGDTLVFSGGQPLTPATAEVSTDSNGSVVFVSVTYPGSGYKFVPEIGIISPSGGSGAKFHTDIGGLNTKYNVSGYAILDAVGSLRGKWASTAGFASSDKYLQDSYYYQDYSYEIQSSLPFADYADIMKKIYHLVGNEMFGKIIKTDLSIGGSYVPSSNVTSGTL